MSEARFTKGLWVAFYPHEILNIGHASVESELGGCIYTVEVYKSNLEERTANANLISAAPEMYATLNNARDFIASDINCGPGGLGLVVIIDELLAKARGEL